MAARSRLSAELAGIESEVVACRRCPRLVAWREQAAREPPRRFEGQAYWARPLPGWGDPEARVMLVGLAPAAHGGNRTGRIFTGDRSGDFLFAALHRTGFANQPSSVSIDDGLALAGAFIAAVVRCAPPANRPSPLERDTCLPYLARELRALDRVAVLVALGGFAWDGILQALVDLGASVPAPKPRFGHGVEAQVGPYTLIGTYHPSQQNTFTGRLTPSMLDQVLLRARSLAGLPWPGAAEGR